MNDIGQRSTYVKKSAHVLYILKYFYYPSEITDYFEDHKKVENLDGGHCEHGDLTQYSTKT